MAKDMTADKTKQKQEALVSVLEAAHERELQALLSGLVYFCEHAAEGLYKAKRTSSSLDNDDWMSRYG